MSVHYPEGLRITCYEESDCTPRLDVFTATNTCFVTFVLQALAKCLTAFCKSVGQQWTINPADGAFYGPKIDIQLMVCVV